MALLVEHKTLQISHRASLIRQSNLISLRIAALGDPLCRALIRSSFLHLRGIRPPASGLTCYIFRTIISVVYNRFRVLVSLFSQLEASLLRKWRVLREKLVLFGLSIRRQDKNVSCLRYEVFLGMVKTNSTAMNQ